MTPGSGTPPISRRRFLGGSIAPVADLFGPMVDTPRCLAANGVYCRSCGDACAADAIRVVPALGGTVRIAIESNRCTECGDCARACPADAITVRIPGERSRAHG